ncbi:MAG: hypothetical protein DI539_09510 [Flavobacterium psychrophilum]|nr:MAG: hypothetical protein DI539_09510 [Flavobacterium psychrophilum]
MKKIILLLTISTLTLLSCSTDDTSPVNNPEQPQPVQQNILYMNTENNFVVSNVYWFGTQEAPDGSAPFVEGNSTINNAQMLKKVEFITNSEDTTIGLKLNNSTINDFPLDAMSRYQLTFKVVDGITILNTLVKIDNA